MTYSAADNTPTEWQEAEGQEAPEVIMRELAEGSGSTWPVFEVFQQAREGQAFTHGGNVLAPDIEMAALYAREFYGRRQESHRIWVVPRDAVHAIEEFPDEFDLKYRRVDGYSIKARLKEARERAGTAAE